MINKQDNLKRLAKHFEELLKFPNPKETFNFNPHNQSTSESKPPTKEELQNGN